VEELCQKVFLSNFEIYQALWAFKVLGLINETEHQPGPESFRRWKAWARRVRPTSRVPSLD